MTTTPPSTRDRLVDAAGELLDRDGERAVTLRAVGEQAGVSRMAAYKHFADKDDLLAELAAGSLRALDARMSAAADAAGRPGTASRAGRRLVAMAQAYVAFALESPDRYRLVFRAPAEAVAHPGKDEAATALHGRFVAAVRAAQDAGALPGGDPALVSAMVWSSAHGAVDLALSGVGASDTKGLADPAAVVAGLVRALGRRGA